MNEFQNYLQDLLTIDCEIQTNLQQLLLIKTRETLEQKSSEIKRGLRNFKGKLNEIKDFCDTINSNGSNTNAFNFSQGLVNRFTNRNSNNIDGSNKATNNGNNGTLTSASSFSHLSSSSLSSPKDLYIKELQIQREHLAQVETRFRTIYMSAQANINQMERAKLIEKDDRSIDPNKLEAKKANINSQVLLKQSNEMTLKLNEINRHLKWTETQTSDIIPVLETSSKSLRNVQQEFGLMKTTINDGKRLLIRLSRREFTDKLLTILCLCFFFSVVFYIVWKRLF